MKRVELDNTEIEQTNEEVTEILDLPDSPFTVIRVEDKYFLALGKYRLTDMLDSKDEAAEQVNDLSWERLLSVMYAVAQEVYAHESAKDKAILNKQTKDDKKEKRGRN